MIETRWAMADSDAAVVQVDGHKYGANDDGAPMLVSSCIDYSTKDAHFLSNESAQWSAVTWVAMYTLLTVARRIHRHALTQKNVTSLQSCTLIRTAPKTLSLIRYTGGGQVSSYLAYPLLF